MAALKDTQRLHEVASALLIIAMILLPLGICGDVFVIFQKVTNSVATSAIVAMVVLAFFYGTWFGFTVYRRAQLTRSG